jgi:two-component system cell cycle sensor histidine kinase/response regulator CckA
MTLRTANEPARILIVDDERHNRQLLEVMLAPEGFFLQTAVSGAEALAMVAQRAPDLILLDVLMPEMDGYQLAGRIKGDLATKNIPVIMVTSLDDHTARMRGLNAGAEDFLSKPLDRAELCVRVRNLVRLKAHGDDLGKYSQQLEDEVVLRTAELVDRTRTLEYHATALRRSEERTNYALGSAGMGVWELDLVTQRITWSETMAPLFGVTQDQAPTSAAAFFALIHPDDRQMVEDSVAAAREGSDYEVEFRVLWPDGSTRWNAGRARLLRDADGKPARLLGVGTDISERKLLEAQLRQAQKMEAVGELAGGVAHDFNNLLTAMLVYATFVIDTFGPEDLRRADMEEVVKAGERAAALTRQLLAFSRKQVLKPTALDLNSLVTGMQQMLSRLIGEHVELVPLLAPDLGFVRADRGQLEQVLMNLVVNARDAMPSGGRVGVATANVDLDASWSHDTVISPGSYVMLAVSDNGSGMDEGTKRRLFEPFFTTKEQGQGTGLGLATVYGIVKQSGGYIWVYSEPGKGATFKVYLPRVDRDAEVAKRVLSANDMTVGTETVLVVEDDAAVRALTRTILERAGYRVLDAPAPSEAEALFDQHRDLISLLVTDVIMPGSSGPKLFERLARQRPGLKVLYVSGYTDDTIVHQGQLDPGIEFLEKPFTANALKLRVREVLDRQTKHA